MLSQKQSKDHTKNIQLDRAGNFLRIPVRFFLTVSIQILFTAKCLQVPSQHTKIFHHIQLIQFLDRLRRKFILTCVL